MSASAPPAATSARSSTPSASPPSTRGRWWFRLWSGPGIGAVVYLLLFIRSLLSFTSGEYMGVKNDDIIGRVLEMFQREIVLLQLQILGLYLLVGATIGALVRLGVTAWAAVRRQPLSRGGLILRVIAGTLLVHAGFLGWTLTQHPQLLADAFYNAGGLSRWVQVALTNTVAPWVFSSLAVLAAAGLATLTALAVRGPWQAQAGQFYRSRALFPALLASGVVAGAAAAPLLPSGTPPPAQDNIIIIAVDSLRPDRFGSGSDALPHLTAFADESIRFDNAWTVMPRTFPSWVSMLTGQYPHKHGIRHMFPSPRTLASRRETLLTRLRERGYRTGVVSDFAGDIFSRVPLGFDSVRVPRFTLWSNVQLGAYRLHYHLIPYLIGPLGGQRTFPILKLWERLADPEALSNEAYRWVTHGDDRPFALVIFYSAPHFPYAVPWPWYKRYTTPDYDGPSKYDKRVWNKDTAPDQAEQDQVRGLYEGALAATDAAIGSLLNRLDDAGLLDRTHVLITADHGENLYEEGFGIGHGDHLRGSGALRIPFVLRPAGGTSGQSVDVPVRSIDLAPTLLDLVKAPPLAQVSGRSLLPLARGTALPDRPVFLETGLWFINPEAAVLTGRTMKFADGFGAFLPDPETSEIYFDPRYDDDFLVAKHRAIIHDGYKLIYIPTRRAVLWELYDLAADPEERTNLVTSRPERFEALRQRLYDWMLSDPQMTRLGDYVVPREPR